MGFLHKSLKALPHINRFSKNKNYIAHNLFMYFIHVLRMKTWMQNNLQDTCRLFVVVCGRYMFVPTTDQCHTHLDALNNGHFWAAISVTHRQCMFHPHGTKNCLTKERERDSHITEHQMWTQQQPPPDPPNTHTHTHNIQLSNKFKCQPCSLHQLLMYCSFSWLLTTHKHMNVEHGQFLNLNNYIYIHTCSIYTSFREGRIKLFLSPYVIVIWREWTPISTWYTLMTTSVGLKTQRWCTRKHSQLYFLRRLKSFNMCSKMLHVFYQSVVASVMFYAVVCCNSGVKSGDAKQLNKPL